MVEQLADNVLQIIDTLLSGKGLQSIVDTGSRLLGNPLFIRDIDFSILAYTREMSVDDPVWNRLILKGYQTYEDFQYLMKNGFIERINKIDVPIYYQVAPNNTNHALPDEIEEIKLIQGTSYIRHRKFDNKITISRVWCKIRLGNNIAGHLVVLEAHRKFNDNDFFLIQKLSDAVALELQKRKSGNKLTREKYELLLQRLLEGEIRDSGSLEEKLKIFDLHFGKKLRLFLLTTEDNETKGMPLTYFRGFFNQLFNRHVFCLLYKGDIIALYHSNTHDKLKDDQKDQLRNFAAETGMPCGISRSFTSLLDINTCYRQGKEAIDSGKRVDPGRFLFFYEDYVMQDIIHICSMHDSLHNFCHPGLLKLIEFDTANNTAYTDTLRSYVMHFKNPSDLAKKLKVHRNTLYYRLNKIEEIMDHTLDSMDTLYNLYLSFKIIEYSGIQR